MSGAGIILTEQDIKEQDINYYEYSEFDNIEKIVRGKAYRANWKQNKRFIALKSLSLNNTTDGEIISEVCNDIFVLV
jgi:hypothetical protein